MVSDAPLGGNLFGAVRHPHLIAHRLNWELHRRILGKSGISVMDQDWDNLCILDACRYDVFKKYNTIEGKLSNVISAGSHTTEFIRNNFTGRYPDTVYLAATPRVLDSELEIRFHKLIHLWDDEWDGDLGTVTPERVASRARLAAERFPNKRLIIHFVQPHYPFIGEKGRVLTNQVNAKSGFETGISGQRSVWDVLAEDEISKEEIWAAYEENLHYLMPILFGLVNDLIGKTVVTSDHGNSFGRWGLYGHPGRKYMSELVEVPWLEIDDGPRKDIVSGGYQETVASQVDSKVVQKRLSDLGYTE